jgi:ribose/xylose/arabinose/galactoside ABC-type transport system permease subunit
MNFVVTTLRRYPVIILLVVLLLAAAIVTPAILTPGNILQTLRQYSVMGIMALGVTFVVLCGRLDVSVGSLLSLLVVVIVALHDVAGPISAMLAGIAIAAIVGAINGYLVAYLRLNSLITTLGGYAALQGVANVTSAGGLQLVKEPESSWFGVFGRGFILNIPVPDILFFGLALFGAWVLSQTNYGRAVKAVGGNELASRYSSIDAKAIIFSAYMASALLTAIAAIVLSSRAMSAQSDSGAGLEITVLSAIFLGGTSLGGGMGGIGRTVLGVIVLAFISNAMILVGLPIQAQWLVSAIVIILAVWLDAATRRGSVLAT